MIPLLRIKCKATGLFAFDKEIKVKKGATLEMRRNFHNEHGWIYSIPSEFDRGIQLIIFNNYHHQDPNCIQVRAPRVKGGLNIGHFEQYEHIGHMAREFSSKLAPILDQYATSGDSVDFNFHLCYSDTNHSS